MARQTGRPAGWQAGRAGLEGCGVGEPDEQSGLGAGSHACGIQAPAAKLPAYAGYDNGSGYTLYRVEKVTADALPNERRAQLQQLLERSRMESEAKALLGACNHAVQGRSQQQEPEQAAISLSVLIRSTRRQGIPCRFH